MAASCLAVARLDSLIVEWSFIMCDRSGLVGCRKVIVGISLLVVAFFSLGLATYGDDPGLRLSAEQVTHVIGGQSSTHNYKGNSSMNVCNNETYPVCSVSTSTFAIANSCVTGIFPAVLSGKGALDFIPKQPCSKTVCNGLPVSCGSATITGCNNANP